MNIYVGNLSYKMKTDNLKALFNEFGEVESAKIIMDRQSGRSKGFGFVEMPDNSQADAAIKGLNEKDLSGRAIRVNEAKPREDRPRRPRY